LLTNEYKFSKGLSMANNIEDQLVDGWKKKEESTGLKGWLEENISKKGLERSMKNTGSIHTVLAAAGMAPGVGNAADIIDAALYGLEGDKKGFGLSLISAIPMLGLVSGGLKMVKGGKKAAGLAKAQKQQVKMVEMTQDVVKKYGGDPTDPKLVSDVTDTFVEASESLVSHSRKFDKLVNAGVDSDDAISVMTYLDSISPRTIKAAKDFKKMGYDEVEVYGKEAVEEMGRVIKKGKEIYNQGERGGFNIYNRLIEGS
jgi:hypothetical protein